MSDLCKEHLSFIVGELELHINIKQVLEIAGWAKITPFPNSLEYVLGLQNYRGNLVPIIDLAKKIGCEPLNKRLENRLIIFANVNDTTIGLCVDDILEINSVEFDEVTMPKKQASEPHTKIIETVSCIDGVSTNILNVDRVYN